MTLAELGAAGALLPDSFFPVLHEVTYDQFDGVLDGMQVYMANERPDMNLFRHDDRRRGAARRHGNSRYGRSTIGPSSGPRQCGVMNRSSWSFHPGLARRR